MRIGIFGGSFDPIHRGHLALAAYAASELDLDKVYFVPSHRTPLKSGERSLPAARRADLVKKAIRAYPRFAFSDVELKRKGVSYTVDTLRAFRKKFRTAQLYFLAGADRIRDFSRWRSKNEVLKSCRFVVLTRPGHRLRTRDRRFLWLPMPPVDVSSSDIRRRLKQGKSIDQLVPAEVGKMLRGQGS